MQSDRNRLLFSEKNNFLQTSSFIQTTNMLQRQILQRVTKESPRVEEFPLQSINNFYNPHNIIKLQQQKNNKYDGSKNILPQSSTTDQQTVIQNINKKQQLEHVHEKPLCQVKNLQDSYFYSHRQTKKGTGTQLIMSQSLDKHKLPSLQFSTSKEQLLINTQTQPTQNQIPSLEKVDEKSFCATLKNTIENENSMCQVNQSVTKKSSKKFVKLPQKQMIQLNDYRNYLRELIFLQQNQQQQPQSSLNSLTDFISSRSYKLNQISKSQLKDTLSPNIFRNTQNNRDKYLRPVQSKQQLIENNQMQLLNQQSNNDSTKFRSFTNTFTQTPKDNPNFKSSIESPLDKKIQKLSNQKLFQNEFGGIPKEDNVIINPFQKQPSKFHLQLKISDHEYLDSSRNQHLTNLSLKQNAETNQKQINSFQDGNHSLVNSNQLSRNVSQKMNSEKQSIRQFLSSLPLNSQSNSQQRNTFKDPSSQMVSNDKLNTEQLQSSLQKSKLFLKNIRTKSQFFNNQQIVKVDNNQDKEVIQNRRYPYQQKKQIQNTQQIYSVGHSPNKSQNNYPYFAKDTFQEDQDNDLQPWEANNLYDNVFESSHCDDINNQKFHYDQQWENL